MLAWATESCDPIKFCILEEIVSKMKEMFAPSLANIAQLIKQHSPTLDMRNILAMKMRGLQNSRNKIAFRAKQWKQQVMAQITQQDFKLSMYM